MKKIVIITGANGFLGNNIVRLIDKNEYIVRAIYHHNMDNIKDLDCEKYQANILDINSLNDVFKCDIDDKLYVIHAAASITTETKFNQEVYDTNVNGTKNIVEKCIETHARLIYISSTHAIYNMPNPIHEIKDFDENKLNDIYAKTKAIATKYVLSSIENSNLDAIILHPSSIIGPYDYSN